MDGLHPLHIPSCGTYVVAYDGGNYGRYMMVQGITARDYVLMQGYIIWITMVFIVINIIIDVLSIWLNPKRRAAIKGGSYE